MNEVPNYGYDLAPQFTALALWVGAIAYFLIMRPITRRALQGRGSPFLVTARSFGTAALIGIAQSILVAFILFRGIGIEVSNPWAVLGMITFASLTFMAINQALISLLGDPGRFIALVLIVLQLAAAGGMYPIETAPAFFSAINPILPLTYTVEFLRSMIAGGTIDNNFGFLVMGAWLIVSLAVTTVASNRERRLANVV